MGNLLKGLLVVLVGVPCMALFVGAGALAWRIGDTWDQRNTDSMVTAMASICAGGAIVIGVMLALIVGVPLALRTYSQGGHAQRSWQQYDRYPQYLPPQQQHPQLVDSQHDADGAFDVSDRHYDFWSESETSDRGRWR